MAKYIVQHRRGTASQWADKDTIIPKEGEIVIEIDEENSLHKLKIGDGMHTYAELAYLMAGDEVITQVLAKALPRVITVTLDVDKWEKVTCETDPKLGYYAQSISIDDVTEYSRLDLQPNADMLAELQKLNLAFVTENKCGSVSVYSIGDMPLKSYTMQATVVETDAIIDDDKIVGIPVGTPSTSYENYVTPEMFGAVGDGVHDDSQAFIKALRTNEIIGYNKYNEPCYIGRHVVCDPTKVYYFKYPVDIRDVVIGHLDGNGAKFKNFHIFINIDANFNTWYRTYGEDRFIIENMKLGVASQDYRDIPEDWETPCIVTGCPTIIRNIDSLHPHVVATVSEYLDYMLFDSIVCHPTWGRFAVENHYRTQSGLEPIQFLDGVCCLANKNKMKEDDEIFYIEKDVKGLDSETGKEVTLGKAYFCNYNTEHRSAGDCWRFLGCQEFRNPHYAAGTTFNYDTNNDGVIDENDTPIVLTQDWTPEYNIMHVGSRHPIYFELCIQCNITVIITGEVICNGCHWEESEIKISSTWGSKVTFIDCFFWANHTIIDRPSVTYLNCSFSMTTTGGIETRELANITGNKAWTDLQCKMVKCQIMENHIIDTDTLKLYKSLPKKTYNEKGINFVNLEDLNFKHHIAYTANEIAEDSKLEEPQLTQPFDTWRPSFFPVTKAAYEYNFYTMTTSQECLANQHKQEIINIDEGCPIEDKTNRDAVRRKNCVELNLENTNGGYGFVIVRKTLKNETYTEGDNIQYNTEHFYKTELYLDPSIDTRTNNITVRYRDHGSWCSFRVSVNGVDKDFVVTPWVKIEEATIFVDGSVYESDGTLVTFKELIKEENGVNKISPVHALGQIIVPLTNRLLDVQSPNLNTAGYQKGRMFAFKDDEGNVTEVKYEDNRSYFMSNNLIEVDPSRSITGYVNRETCSTVNIYIAEYLEDGTFNTNSLVDGNIKYVQRSSATKLLKYMLQPDTKYIKIFDFFDYRSFVFRPKEDYETNEEYASAFADFVSTYIYQSEDGQSYMGFDGVDKRLQETFYDQIEIALYYSDDFVPQYVPSGVYTKNIPVQNITNHTIGSIEDNKAYTVSVENKSLVLRELDKTSGEFSGEEVVFTPGSGSGGDADVDTIVNEVLNRLPTWDGGSY